MVEHKEHTDNHYEQLAQMDIEMVEYYEKLEDPNSKESKAAEKVDQWLKSDNPIWDF